MSTGCATFNSCFSSLSLAPLFFQSYRFSGVSGLKAPVTESNRKQLDVLTPGSKTFLFQNHAKLQTSNTIEAEAVLYIFIFLYIFFCC